MENNPNRTAVTIGEWKVAHDEYVKKAQQIFEVIVELKDKIGNPDFEK